MSKYTIGVDYGTDSVRTVWWMLQTGKRFPAAFIIILGGKPEKYCDPANNRFRQHPLDYLEGIEITVKEVIAKAPKGAAEQVAAISVDTTGPHLLLLIKAERHWPCSLNLQRIPMPCLFCGKTIRELQKPKRSTILQEAGAELITQNLKEEFIPPSGSGQRFSMSCAKILL